MYKYTLTVATEDASKSSELHSNNLDEIETIMWKTVLNAQKLIGGVTIQLTINETSHVMFLFKKDL